MVVTISIGTTKRTSEYTYERPFDDSTKTFTTTIVKQLEFLTNAEDQLERIKTNPRWY